MHPHSDADGRLPHLLDLSRLPAARIDALLRRAQAFADGAQAPAALAGVAVCTLFFEPSTRTRSSFTLAAQRRTQLIMDETDPLRIQVLLDDFNAAVT